MSIYDVVQWVRTNGDIHAINRLRLRTLATTIKEGISISQLSPQTSCSEACLETVRQAASEIVGQECPV
jgi:hypothetical protein